MERINFLKKIKSECFTLLKKAFKNTIFKEIQVIFNQHQNFINYVNHNKVNLKMRFLNLAMNPFFYKFFCKFFLIFFFFFYFIYMKISKKLSNIV